MHGCRCHYLGRVSRRSISCTSASLTCLKDRPQETRYPLNNHFKTIINRTSATLSQEPTRVSLQCILQSCPYYCSLWSALYKIIRSFKDISVGLEALHPCTMCFKKKLFFFFSPKRNLQSLGHSPAKQLTAWPPLTGAAWVLP